MVANKIEKIPNPSPKRPLEGWINYLAGVIEALAKEVAKEFSSIKETLEDLRGRIEELEESQKKDENGKVPPEAPAPPQTESAAGAGEEGGEEEEGLVPDPATAEEPEELATNGCA
jgi:TolA-binding protein